MISSFPATSASMFTPVSNSCRREFFNDSSMKSAAAAYARGRVTLRSPISPASVWTTPLTRRSAPELGRAFSLGRRWPEGPDEGSSRASLQFALAPSRFVRETGVFARRAQSSIALRDVEPNAPLQLAQIDGAEVQRACIGFAEMIRSVEHATEVDAVLDAEHVRSLVCHDFAAPARLAAVSRKGIHAD